MVLVNSLEAKFAGIRTDFYEAGKNGKIGELVQAINRYGIPVNDNSAGLFMEWMDQYKTALERTLTTEKGYTKAFLRLVHRPEFIKFNIPKEEETRYLDDKIRHYELARATIPMDVSYEECSDWLVKASNYIISAFLQHENVETIVENFQNYLGKAIQAGKKGKAFRLNRDLAEDLDVINNSRSSARRFIKDFIDLYSFFYKEQIDEKAKTKNPA